MDCVRNLKNLSKEDVSIAGGKGASLGEMTQAGILVPPGFVVLSSAFEEFIEKTDLNVEIDNLLHEVNIEKIHTVENASAQIQSLIRNKDLPQGLKEEILKSFRGLNAEFVAVRSSATAEDSASAAWAGQLDSFLNVTEKELFQRVQDCWASLFTPRAIFYRFDKELHTEKISVAVVVQQMVQSEISGIAFSVHPVTEDQNQMIIEAGLGLGEAIVSGAITPDSYVVEKEPRRILDINVNTQKKALYRAKSGNEWKDLDEEGEKQVLEKDQILELSNLIVQIEEHYGFPVDIEWATEGEGFYIVQSRPITTLSGSGDLKEQNDYLSSLKKNGWELDWDADLSHIALSLTYKSYFTKPQELFGTHIPSFFTTFRKGKMSGYLRTEELEAFSQDLVSHVDTVEKAKKWAQSFKLAADEITEALHKTSPKKFLDKLDYYSELFDNYGAWQIATKAVYRELPSALDNRIPEILEDSRKYSEKFYKELGIFHRIGEYIAKKEDDYSAREITAMTSGELKEYINNGSLPEKDTLYLRWKCSGMFFKDDETASLLNCEEVEEIEQSWIVGFDGRAIKGVSAYQGFVRGPCRIISDFNKARLEEGDILVTIMTNPNYVPLMKKAAAFITDGGGMLCHAAIVARELKKPCIIGTKIATEVLKDGDIVEVDADEGVVRILDKQKSSKRPQGILKEINKKEWKKLFARPFSVQRQEGPIFQAAQLGMKEILIIPSDTKGVYHWYFVPDQVKKLGKEVEEMFFDKKEFDEHIKKHKKGTKDIVKLFNLDLEGKTKEELGHIYQKFMGVFSGGFSKTYAVPFGLEGYVIPRVKKRLKKELTNFDKAWEVIEQPTDFIEIQKAQIQISKLKLQGKLNQSVPKLLKEYKWLTIYDFYDKPANSAFIKSLVLADSKKAIEEKILEMNVEIEKGKKELEKLVESIDNKEMRQAVKAINFYITFRAERMDNLRKILVAIKPFYERLLHLLKSENSDWDFDDVVNLTKQEVEEILLEDKTPVLNAVKSRSLISSYHYYMEGKYHSINDLAEDIEGILKEETTFDTNELKGDVSYKGKIRGVVKIVDSVKDLFKVEEGNIIVSSMTKPDYIAAMKKAAAFVTDEGGITCHAAITARELKKPCITGTNIATRILKDGDKIEVDADNGVVKILGETKNDHDWEYYLARPFNLFSTSVWNLWYTTDEIEKLFGFKFKEGLFIEHPKGTVRHYRERSDLKVFQEKVNELVSSSPKRIEKLLQKSEQINKEAEEHIKSQNISTLNKAIDFSIQLALYSTILPYFVGLAIGDKKQSNLKKLSDELREISFYPLFFKEVLIPIAKKILTQSGVQRTEILNVTTLSELESGSFDEKEKSAIVDSNKSFVYEVANNKEVVTWTQSPEEKIQEIEKVDFNSDTLKGEIAYKGVVSGSVRLVFSDDISSLNFEKGDILVALSTNPNLLPIMKIAGAIVTDEGGIISHAAIVARELKKPCIIGTKFATQILKDGDEVEVNADEGIVKLLNKKKQESKIKWPHKEDKNLFGFWDEYNSSIVTPLEYDLYYKTIWQSSLDMLDFGDGVPKIEDVVVFKDHVPIQVDPRKYEKLYRREETKDDLEKVVYKWRDDVKKALDDLGDVNNLDKEGLKKYIKKISKKYQKMVRARMLQMNLWIDVEKETKEFFEKSGAEVDMVQILKGIDHETNKMNKSLHLLATLRKGTNPSFDKKFEEFFKEFGHFNVTESSMEESKKTLLHQIENISKSGVQHTDLLKEFKEYKSELMNSVKDKEKFEKMISKLRKAVKLRENSKTLQDMPRLIIKNLIETLGEIFVKEGKLENGKDVYLLTLDELEKESFGREDLTKRRQALEEKRNNSWLPSDFAPNQQKGELLEGVSGSSGKVRGKAKIILDPSEFNLLTRGDILIARSTSPAWTQLFSLAKGVVVEHGTILSHAAVTAREYGIPCVVGVSGATEQIKNGDEVEVNADEGIVNILKRS